ncbi:PucR family transcriptional regulator ligand-binding domain-containing protein [Streptomyces sp. NPDC051907]|uniref:PucR family transcriptional regulator ligand-binding domain-containing protein n=1 Tax=Streptomyces sp. NPDC051907 TaxID=3155284 RepID=UPI003424F577
MPEPTAAAPPTPPITLSALLLRDELGLRQIAGPDAVVHWVHTSEMEDPYPYLLGGELLLSSGMFLKEPADSERYVARIVQAGAAALGFGVAPVHDTVPRGLAEACERYGLPLLEVPPRTTFTAVARAVWQLMAQARHRELRRVTQAQQGLAAAAARPDPIPAVLHQLASRLEGWAVLLSPDGAELHASGRSPSPEARAGLGRLARVVGGMGAAGEGARPTASPAAGPTTRAAGEGPRPAAFTATPTSRAVGAAGEGPRPASSPAGAPSSATDSVPGAHLSAYALGGGQGLALGLVTEAREPGDHTVAGVAVVLLSLLTAPHQGAEADGRSAALVRLLLGARAEEVAGLLGPGPWTVVRARGDRGERGTPLDAAALGAALGSALVDPDAEGTVRVVLPADRPATAQTGWVLGVSAAAAPEELAAADAQAAMALRRATATRVDLVAHRESSLAGLLPPGEADAHARALLAPLAGSPALVETLRAWLSLHGSWDRTAAAMEIHRNTVRQRIARCASLLEEDLDDADVRMELWFALRRL